MSPLATDVLAELHRRGVDTAARPMAHVLEGIEGLVEVARMAGADARFAADAIVQLADDVARAWRSERLERAVALSRRCAGLATRLECGADGVPLASPANRALYEEFAALMPVRDAAYRELNGLEATEYLRRCRQVD